MQTYKLSKRGVHQPVLALETQAGVYAIWCRARDAVYVGSSVQLQRRINGHFRYLQQGTHETVKLQALFNEVGLDGLEVEILEHFDEGTEQYDHELLEAEDRWTYKLRGKSEILGRVVGRTMTLGRGARSRQASRKQMDSLAFARSQLRRWTARVQELELREE